jgi:hypothetical protein
MKAAHLSDVIPYNLVNYHKHFAGALTIEDSLTMYRFTRCCMSKSVFLFDLRLAISRNITIFVEGYLNKSVCFDVTWGEGEGGVLQH